MADDERRRRLIQLASAGAFLAICAIAVLIVLSQSGADSDDSGGDTTIESAQEVSAELRGVDQSGTVLGDPDAEVTITEYGDLQCPVCARFSQEIVPDVISGPVASGDANFDFRQWAILGPDSEEAARAALAAADQGAYWEFVELAYRNQGVENSGYVTDDYLRALAEAAGVEDLDAWDEARSSDEVAAQLAQVNADAEALGLTGTPSLVVTGPGGERQLGFATLQEIEAAIDEVSG